MIKKYILRFSFLFAAFVLIAALRFGIAELYSLSANRTMQDWKLASQSPSVVEIESVASQLNTARFLSGSNPVHHENIARLNLIRAALADVNPDEKKSILRRGLAEIHTAISLRPVSPYSWTILLLIKRDLGEFDAEFIHALHRAVELGPWEPELLTALADVGLSAWTAMPAAEQALIQQVFVRGIERQGSSMKEIAEVHLNECAVHHNHLTGCQ
jgi:hypothetical protein